MSDFEFCLELCEGHGIPKSRAYTDYEGKLKSFPEEASEILKRNPLMPDQRRDAVIQGLQRSREYAIDYIKDSRHEGNRAVSLVGEASI